MKRDTRRVDLKSDKVYFYLEQPRRSKNLSSLRLSLALKLIDCHLCRAICFRSTDRSFNVLLTNYEMLSVSLVARMLETLVESNFALKRLD